MAYIKSEQVSEFRQQIKAAFPGWKFSITKENFSAIRVTILQAPIQMINNDLDKPLNRTYVQTNVYYIHEHYKDRPDVMKALLKIKSICMKGNHDNSDIMTDYHDVGWYVYINIGDYDKPFIYAPVAESSVKEQTTTNADVENIQIVDYSEKAIAVIGNTKPLKDKLYELGGRYNKYLKCGEGWIFSKKRLDSVQTLLNNAS